MLCLNLVLLRAADLSLGKVDKGSLSDQTLMELLFDGLTEDSKDSFILDGAYTDACLWPGVSCNENHSVEKIAIINFFFEGTVSFDYLPPHLTEFSMPTRAFKQKRLVGTLDTAEMPRKMQKFDIFWNAISGTVDMTSLPPSLSHLNLARNNFSGTCDLTALPESMTYLSVARNQLTGSIALDALPNSLETLILSFNSFSGTLCFDKLPEKLGKLILQSNKFGGEFRLEKVPQALFSVPAEDNLFSGTAVVSSRDFLTVTLGGKTCSIDAVVDENGEKHTNEKYILQL